MNRRFKVGSVCVSETNLADATQRIIGFAEARRSGYVCVANVRAVYWGNHDPDYASILNKSLMTLPDGKPLEWYARLDGRPHVRKSSGPDLLNRICEVTEKTALRHFFFGSSPLVLDSLIANLKKKFPELKIAGAISPPFASHEELAGSKYVEEMQASNASFIWVGLGAPKQERFISLVKDRFEGAVLIGVGLAFDYQANSVRRAPVWMQRVGLEWSYVWMQQPQKVRRSIPCFVYFLRLMARRAYENTR